MKKILTFGLMLLFILMTVSSANEVYMEQQSIKPVSFDNILYVGGSGPGNYTKIQDAINDSSDGDTVYVYDDSSPYYENIIIDKSIQLLGENKQTTIIDGSRKDDVIRIIADFVKINEFTIQNSHYDDGAGIRLDTSDNCSITDNILSHNNEYGLKIWNSYNCNISGNTISYTRCGIHIESKIYPFYSGQILIEDNIIKETFSCITIARNRNVIKILNNIIIDSWYGVYLWNIIKSIKIKGNIISGNRVGIDNSGQPQFRTTFITISENIISSNSWYGIQIWNSGQSIIYKNNFKNNSVNAYVELHNFRHLGTNKWYFLLKGNYWDDWTGSGPKIIHGNHTFSILNIWSKIIPWKNYDRFPASEPYDIGI